MFAGSPDHGIERGTLPVNTGIILIRIDLVDFKTLFHSIRGQHGLLVLDAFRLAVFSFILLAQAAVNCRFHGLRPLFLAQVSLLSISPASPLCSVTQGHGRIVLQCIHEIALKRLFKLFPALFLAVGAEFFVQNESSFFHKHPLFGLYGRFVRHLSLFPTAGNQNFSIGNMVKDSTKSLPGILLEKNDGEAFNVLWAQLSGICR